MNGLRKAPQAFQAWFTKVAKECGWKPVVADSQVFYHREHKLFLDVHVDDPLMVGKRENMKKAWQELGKKMQMKVNPVVEVGSSIAHLGYVYTRTEKGFRVQIQPGYSEDTLDLAGMKNCKGIRTPCCGPLTKEDVALKEEKADSPEEHELFRKIVGRIQFLTGNRDDILYATKEIARDLAAPTCYS